MRSTVDESPAFQALASVVTAVRLGIQFLEGL